MPYDGPPYSQRNHSTALSLVFVVTMPGVARRRLKLSQTEIDKNRKEIVTVGRRQSGISIKLTICSHSTREELEIPSENTCFQCVWEGYSTDEA